MRSSLIMIVSGLLLTSCATLFNTKSTSVHFRKPANLELRGVDKGHCTSKNSCKVPRNGDTLIAHLKADSTYFDMKIAPRKSFVYWENVLNLGIGFLIDENTDKKYSYPRKIRIEKVNDTYVRVKDPVFKKGEVILDLTFPYVNWFRVKTDKDFRSSNGFIGIGFGLNYAYKNNRYLSFNAGWANDLFIPVPAPIHYSSEYHRNNIQYYSLRHHFCIKRLDLGVGLNFSHSYYWGRFRADSLNDADYKRSSENIGMGLSIAARYFGFWPVSIGLIYQPGFIGFYPSGSGFGYQHFISVEVLFRLKCISAKRRKK